MDENCAQAYWQLIDMLLKYNGQVNEVLNANQELIDKGLVDEMREVVARFCDLLVCGCGLRLCRRGFNRLLHKATRAQSKKPGFFPSLRL